MFIVPTPTELAAQLKLNVGEGRKSPFETSEQVAGHRPCANLDGCMEDTARPAELEIACVSTSHSYYSNSSQASPRFGRVRSELMRTSSAPSEVQLNEEPVSLQTSGLEWSGSVEGPTLIALPQQVQCESEGSDGGMGPISFPPQERYRQAVVSTMSRLSEDWGRSSTLSDSLCASVYGDRTGSSQMAGEEGGTPMLSKHSSSVALSEVPESPFEAPQFQEAPIYRPAVLPEVAPEDVARGAATVPPAGMESLLSSPKPRPAESELAPGRKDRLSPRSPGFKPLLQLQATGASLVPRQEAKVGSPSIQQLALEGLQALAAIRIVPASSGGLTSGQRSVTEPSHELLRSLEASMSAKRSSTTTSEEEEDMMATASLQQAISRFQPMEESVRSPTRAPSLFDLPGTGLADSEWVIQRDELELGRRIGSGSFGEVFRAQWRHTDVAVKCLSDVTEALVEDFRKEVALMAKLKHPNVVQFLGACIDYPNLAIVTQFMPRGSLFNLLHRAKVHLDDRQKLWMALDCAKGMHYLHSCRPPIVHGDVSSKNMLVDRDFSIRVADFGMSRQRRKAMLSSEGQARGTAEWTAPEVLRGQPYRESCDVWSFGVILYELMTQQVPWSELSSIQVVGAVGWGKASLQIPDSVPQPVRELMAKCMERDPEQRPAFGDIIVSLRQIRAALPPSTSGPTQPPPAAPAPSAPAAPVQPESKAAAPAAPETAPGPVIQSRHTF